MKYAYLRRLSLAALLLVCVAGFSTSAFAQSQNPQSGSVGLQGTISAPPPSQPATISVPSNGQVFTEVPITVSGICQNGLLVKLFKNEVFAGAAQCANGSYSITADLFDGRNDLVARVFDELDQAGPDSNVVTVTFNNAQAITGNRVTVTSLYAKRGAAPGSVLLWPITISGGTGPYAVSVDWGDKKSPDLLTRQFPGDFNIEHTYDAAGVYNVVVKVTDANGVSAFLQLVGVGNGPVAQQTGTNTGDQAGGQNTATSEIQRSVLWWPVLLLVPFTLSAFWLGHRHQMHTIRRKIIEGERPF